MPDDTYKIVKDMVLYLFTEISSRDMKITERDLQNLIFKIKMDLGEDNELYDKLPFYWYRDGPQCDVVSNVIKELES